MVGNLDWLVSELSDEVLVDNEMLLQTLENVTGAELGSQSTFQRVWNIFGTARMTGNEEVIAA